MLGARENKYEQQASELLMTTLQFGGPADERLRVILYSCRGKSLTPRGVFSHVCEAWRPIRDSAEFRYAPRPLEYAVGLRIIAAAVLCENCPEERPHGSRPD